MNTTMNTTSPTAVGIMQGRLLPPFDGRFQAFPARGWELEFAAARDAGLACIEWIFEEPNQDANPMASDAGHTALRSLISETGVQVRSVCADYYMTRRLIAPGGRIDETVAAHARWLMERASRLKVSYIVLPFVDASSLADTAERDAAAVLMADLAPEAAAAGLELHLETDLPPAMFAALLERVGHPAIRANYDIGNSASLGYDPTEELTTLAPWLGSVHVKDRRRGGGTVPLGTGDADFPTCFHLIRRAGFARPFILQAARGEAGDEVAWARQNRSFVERHMAVPAEG